ncbi:Acyl-coenzyme A thioesterase 13 [Holothuria leucospilota]|uniref:Acyl-coenzyme A thioesterase 13 n=1 Tax=Holothuria leucospilota TaxID=206669 RepID=A0A9Q1CRR4_HOLLE|nr:Acyl-coenzyme A thioesterase 13 [Holothuria leucospilota]
MASSSKAILEKLMKHAIERNGFDVFLKNISVLSVEPGKVNFGMEVQKEHTNQGSTMHGGLTSSLVDSLTTLALMTTENPTPGVSVNLAVSYFKAARIGDKLTIEAEVLKQGKTLAFTEAKILNQKGDIIATGHHVKHIGS